MTRAGVRELNLALCERVFYWRVLALGADLLQAGKSHLNCRSTIPNTKHGYKPLSVVVNCMRLC